jgi:hypothetical protein
MTTQTTLTIQADITIGKPAKETFDAVLYPVPYFIKKASAPLKQGEDVQWEFQESPKSFPVRVREVNPNEHSGIRLQAVRCRQYDRLYLRNGMAGRQKGPRGFTAKLQRLDANALLSQGAPRIRNQSSQGRFHPHEARLRNISPINLIP